MCSTDTKDLDAKTLARYHEQARKRWQEKAEAVEREQQEIRRREQEMLKIQQLQQQQYQQHSPTMAAEHQEHAQEHFVMRKASMSDFVPAPFAAMGSRRTTSTLSSDDSCFRRNTESIGFLPVMQQQQQLVIDNPTTPRPSSGTHFPPFNNTIFEESNRRRDTESVGFFPAVQLDALRNQHPQQQQQHPQQEPGLATFSHRLDSRRSSTSSAGSTSAGSGGNTGSRLTVPKSLEQCNTNRPGSPLALNRNTQVLHRGHMTSMGSTGGSGTGGGSGGPQPSSVLLADSHDAIHDDFMRSVMHAKSSVEKDPRASLNDGDDDVDGTLVAVAVESPRNDRATPLTA